MKEEVIHSTFNDAYRLIDCKWIHNIQKLENHVSHRNSIERHWVCYKIQMEQKKTHTHTPQCCRENVELFCFLSLPRVGYQIFGVCFWFLVFELSPDRFEFLSIFTITTISLNLCQSFRDERYGVGLKKKQRNIPIGISVCLIVQRKYRIFTSRRKQIKRLLRHVRKSSPSLSLLYDGLRFCRSYIMLSS